MPIATNLNIHPYYDDFDETKDYYRILFQPGVSVQVRELNQLQSLLQKQIERFGDNIFKKGTIVTGCNFAFYNNYPYVKINDNDTFNVPTVPSVYVGKFVRSDANLVAHVIKSYDGYETASPDLKTLYLKYNNSGNNGNTHQFSPGDTLTVYNPDNSIFNVTVNNGGTGFSNSDQIAFTSCLVVNMQTGSNFTVGEYINNGLSANVEITDVDITTLANDNFIIVSYKPLTSDLANSSFDPNKWTFNINESIVNSSNTKVGKIFQIYGSGAEASVITDAAGIIQDVLITTGGEGYEIAPHASVISKDNTTGINTANLTVRNYITKIIVNQASDAVGSGYAFGVSEGVIYQKGYFLRVPDQMVVVDKYSNQPNNLVVGFRTIESFVTYNDDDSLFDNINSSNKNAPGANRLRLEPVLYVTGSQDAAANLEFFDLVEWNNGLPYKQNQLTQYSHIGDEMAQRMFDQSGNFIVDTFQVGTKYTSNTRNEGKYYSVMTDPGQAYIHGYKVQTLRNYIIDMRKGLSTATGNNFVSINYGNYVRTNEVAGIFPFSTAEKVELWFFPAQHITKNATTITPVGFPLGTARIRSLIHEDGVPGSNTAIYRLYLFDVKMSKGYTFEDVASIAYYDSNSSSYKGIADCIRTNTVKYPSQLLSNGSIANAYVKTITRLNDTNKNKLLFDSGAESLKYSYNSTYQYRTLDTGTYFSNTVALQLSKTIAGSGEYFPYGTSSQLSDAEMKELYVVPTNNHIYQFDYLAGNVISYGNTLLTGDLNINFYDNFVSGDYIHISPDGLSNTIVRVVSIATQNSMTVSANVAANSTGDMWHRRIFPKNIPIPFGSRAGLSANTNGTGKTINLYLNHSNGIPIQSGTTDPIAACLGVNVERRNVTATSKSAQRKQYVKICVGNNNTGKASSNTIGPWCIGVPDAMRLRNVYLGTNSSVNTSSQVVTNDFYLDHNQNANYLDLGWLYKQQRSGLRLTNSNWLLVEFDYFLGGDAGGYFDTFSYLNETDANNIATNESLTLAELTNETFCNSWEVPEVYTYDDQYFDLLNTFDFRPSVIPTCSPTTSPGTAPVNPSANISFSSNNTFVDKKFPVPDARMSTTIEQYLGRVDSVFISGDDTGHIYVIEGISAADPRKRLAANYPKTSLKIQEITVPPYPNISQNVSKEVLEILTTRIANEKSLNLRVKSHVIKPLYSTLDMQLSQPMVYTMEDIGTLERRIADLEYYQSLSVLETSITNKIIPSSVDSTMNRFKFGFFADDFSTTNYCDLENPQYAASIEQEGDQYYGISKDPLTPDQNWASADKVDPQSKLLSPGKLVKKVTNRVVPPKQIITVNHVTENISWVDYDIIDQLNATDQPVINNCPSGNCTNTCVITKPIINTTCNDCIHHIHYHHRGLGWAFGPDKDELFELHFSLPGFPHIAGYYGDHGIVGIATEIWQGNKLVATSKRDHPEDDDEVEDWDDDDKGRLKKVCPEWFEKYHDHDSNGERKHKKDNDDDHFTGCGRIRWTHNPADGDDYKIKCRAKGHFKFIIEHKCSNTIVGWTTEPCANNPPPPTGYNGRLICSQNFGAAWACSKNFVINGINMTWLNLIAMGMKPNTNHKFYVDGVDETRNTIQMSSGTQWGQGERVNLVLAQDTKNLLTNKHGMCHFRLFFKAGLPGFKSTGSGKLFDTSANWLAIIYNAHQNKQSFGSSGYSLFEFKNNIDSYAKLIVPRRKPEVTFSDSNPRGYP